ncbi:hypothetical protein B0H19DRAFT_1082401 [Mycena capillaripes]|nr:hypothetical protein B0H19DRAFT_1082401 [Mycena capillaripes]
MDTKDLGRGARRTLTLSILCGELTMGAPGSTPDVRIKYSSCQSTVIIIWPDYADLVEFAKELPNWRQLPKKVFPDVSYALRSSICLVISPPTKANIIPTENSEAAAHIPLVLRLRSLDFPSVLWP